MQIRLLRSCLYLILLSVVAVSCNKQPLYKIGVSQCSDDDWRQKMNKEIEREMMFHPEAEVEIRSAEDNSEKQISDIRYFMNNNFDAIVVAPNEADALTPVITEAYEKGIPVVVFDRNIHGKSFTAWQGADNRSIGKAAANYAVKLAGKDAPVLEIYGLKGSTPADERYEGFNSVEGINVVGRGYGNWNYQEALPVADSLLAAHPDAKVIYAHNDRMALAASDAAKKRGLSPYIIGIDAAPEIGIKGVVEKQIDATFLYPTEGHRLIRTALAIIKGEPYDTVTSLPTPSAVDASNADLMLMQNEALANETKRMEQLKTQMDDYWSQHTSQTAMFYAVLVIVLLLFVVIFMLLRAFWQRRCNQILLMKQNEALQEERDKQKVLLEQLAAATSSKLAFFTNVSHDLRTPLTLISEPVEQLASSGNISDRERALMKIASKNVHILRRLINQILDFRKYENDKLQLSLTEIDLPVLIREWGNAFDDLATRKNIDFQVKMEEGCTGTMAVDVEKMERVFYNLVSNAFKFTSGGGSITVTCSSDDQQFTFSVADTGSGIPKNEIANIFDRFFQGDTIHPSGSGIGLALAKAFVELHEGSIKVKSVEGEGTVFTVRIPVTHTDNKAIMHTSSECSAEQVNSELRTIEEDSEPDNVSPDQPTLLVIDDNADIRVLLRELLSDTYVIVSADNGETGILKAEKYVPDLIICDVMMPGIDGLEVCRRLKENVATSHIPVLMLTACAMDEQRVEGYRSGAEGYLSKPFNSEVLKARISNLIESRQRIKALWQSENNKEVSSDQEKSTETQKSSSSSLTKIESEFYQRFLQHFTEHMSNPELGMDDLASAMGLGYSQLYRKIKSLTGHRPVELIRLLRLEKARELLLSTEKTISEISYEVGFSTPAYFTKCYREHYSETPSDTRTPKDK